MRRSLSLLLSLTILLPQGTAFASVGSQKVEERPHRYQEAIDYVRRTGIMPAFGDGMFHPEQPVSRVELIMTVVSDVYSQENFGACFDNIAPRPPARFSLLFTDVPVTASYAPELCVGMLVGIVSGSPDGRFRPYENSNLVEAAKVIGKAYGTAPLPSLRPQPKVPWYESYRYGLARNDAIPPTVKNLRQELNRGELAYILWKLRNERPEQGFRYKRTTPKASQKNPAPAKNVQSPMEPTTFGKEIESNVIRFSPYGGQKYWGDTNQGITIVETLPSSGRPRTGEKPVYRELRKQIRDRK